MSAKQSAMIFFESLSRKSARLARRNFVLVGLFFCFSTLALADNCLVLAKIAEKENVTSGFGARFGSNVELKFTGSETVNNAVFIGRFVDHLGDVDHLAFYDATNLKLHLIPSEQVQLTYESDVLISSKQVVPRVNSTSQVGGTCGAYTAFNCLLEMKNRGHDSTKLLNTARGRQDLMVEIIIAHQKADSNATYRTLLAGVLKKFGYEFYNVPKAELHGDKLYKYMQDWPVIIEYDVEWRKNVTQYSTSTVDINGSLKEMKQWLPVRDGVKPAGRHQVLALGTFVDGNGKYFIVVADPNWDHPILWDWEELNGTTSANIEYLVMYKPK